MNTEVILALISPLCYLLGVISGVRDGKKDQLADDIKKLNELQWTIDMQAAQLKHCHDNHKTSASNPVREPAGPDDYIQTR